MGRRWWMTGLCVMLALGAGGCELLYFMKGKGKQPALFQFSKTQHVLVLVEVRDEISLPPYVASTLADSIGKHLWKYHAVEAPLVSQEVLVILQTTRQEDYKKMGVADIAQATGADAVLRVYITQFMTPTTTEGMVSEGYAEAYVKVVGRKGERMFPGDLAGVRLAAKDSATLVSDRSMTRTVQDLIDQLSTQTGRMFHEYDVEDSELNPARLDPVRQNGKPGE